MNDDLEKKLREARFFVEKMREQEARAFRARPCFASSRSPTAALQPCWRLFHHSLLANLVFDRVGGRQDEPYVGLRGILRHALLAVLVHEA
jgi:hypothetical protein